MVDGVEALKSAPSLIGGVQFLTKQANMNNYMSVVGKAKKKRKRGSDKAKDILKGGSK